MTLLLLLKKSSMAKFSIFKIFFSVLAVLYPCFIFLGLKNGINSRFLTLFLLMAVFCSFIHHKSKILFILGSSIVCAHFLSRNAFFIYIYPVVTNLLFTSIFIISLNKTPIIEIFARKIHKKLDEKAIIYTRKATIAWSIFLTINTIASFITLFLSVNAWTLYNGLISYLLIGMMMLAEWCIRKKIQKG